METLGAGLVYVLLKHFVDRYNIFFAYAPSRINKNIHTSAIYFVLAAFWVLQLTLLFFSLLRYGLYGVTIFALVGCVLTFLLVVFQAWFRRFRSLAPISYRVSQDKNLAPNHRIPPSAMDDALLDEYAADSSHFPFVCFWLLYDFHAFLYFYLSFKSSFFFFSRSKRFENFLLSNRF